MRLSFFIGLLLILCSCSKGHREYDFASMAELERYVNDESHGYIQFTETSELKFNVKMVPQIHEEKDSQITFHLRIDDLSGQSVLNYGNASESEIVNRQTYLSFQVLSDVYVEHDQEIVPAVFHHYERNYGLKPSIDIVFHFPAFTAKEDVKFCYRDELFGQGLVTVVFDNELFKPHHVKS